jgi:hypothetical protein
MGGRRTKLAYHEAGHAVIARVLGVEVTGVMMFRTEGATAVAMTRSAAYLARGKDIATFVAGLEIDAKVALAGAIAQHRRKPTKSQHGWGDDAKNATNCMATAVIAEREGKVPEPGIVQIDAAEETRAKSMLDRARTETEALVEANWPAIERAAAALQVRAMLSQDDLDALIAGKS